MSLNVSSRKVARAAVPLENTRTGDPVPVHPSLNPGRTWDDNKIGKRNQWFDRAAFVPQAAAEVLTQGAKRTGNNSPTAGTITSVAAPARQVQSALSIFKIVCKKQ